MKILLCLLLGLMLAGCQAPADNQSPPTYRDNVILTINSDGSLDSGVWHIDQASLPEFVKHADGKRIDIHSPGSTDLSKAMELRDQLHAAGAKDVTIDWQ